MRKKLIFNALLVAGLFATVLSCTIEQGQSLLSSRTDGQDAVAKVLSDVPFAYDLVFDTISYNSCVGTALNSNNIPGFKMGANGGFANVNGDGAVTAGLKLRSDFLQYLGKNMPPSFPNTTVTPGQIQYILQNSDLNKQLSIQYAVRTAIDLKVVPDTIAPTSEVVFGRDGVLESGVISESPIVTALTKNIQIRTDGTLLTEGSRIYNTSTASTPDPFEATFEYSTISDNTFPITAGADDSLGAAEEYADRVRAKFTNSTYVLAVTYGGSIVSAADDGAGGLNTMKRPANSTDARKAYGRSYNLTFSSKNSGLSSHRKNILTAITEKNLETNTPVSGASAQWKCDNVVIMKMNQLNNKKASEPSCAEITADDLTVTRVSDLVKKIRRHYSEQTWAIGLFYNKNEVYNPLTRAHNLAGVDNGRQLCLVNKATECYLPTTNIVVSSPSTDVGVEYDVSKECYLSRYQQMGVTYSGNKTGDSARLLGRCPQYASICTRTGSSF